jgi:hypothetical protein
MDPSIEGSSSSKAKIINGDDHDRDASGFKPHHSIVTVVPPKPDDLQRSYAAIVTTDANPKGWYGSMSTSSLSHCAGRRDGTWALAGD